MTTIYGLEHCDPLRSIAGADAIFGSIATLQAAFTSNDTLPDLAANDGLACDDVNDVLIDDGCNDTPDGTPMASSFLPGAQSEAKGSTFVKPAGNSSSQVNMENSKDVF